MTTLDALNVELATARKLFWLLREDHIFLSSYNSAKGTWDDGAYPAINCNDVFVSGADAEGLDAEELDTFIDVVKRFPNVGDLAWCAVKRSAHPWRSRLLTVERQREFEEATAFVKTVLAEREKERK